MISPEPDVNTSFVLCTTNHDLVEPADTDLSPLLWWSSKQCFPITRPSKVILIESWHSNNLLPSQRLLEEASPGIFVYIGSQYWCVISLYRNTPLPGAETLSWYFVWWRSQDIRPRLANAVSIIWVPDLCLLKLKQGSLDTIVELHSYFPQFIHKPLTKAKSRNRKINPPPRHSSRCQNIIRVQICTLLAFVVAFYEKQIIL